MKAQDYMDGRVLIAREDYDRLRKIELDLADRMVQAGKLARMLADASRSMEKAMLGMDKTYHFKAGFREGLKSALEVLGSKPERPDDGLPF